MGVLGIVGTVGMGGRGERPRSEHVSSNNAKLACARAYVSPPRHTLPGGHPNRPNTALIHESIVFDGSFSFVSFIS